MGYVEDLRKIIGNQPLNLVGSVVAVIDEQGKVLLQKRPEGVWGLPGGLLELGESAEEAARREVTEETGVLIGKLQLLEVFSGKQYYRKLANGDEFYPITIAYVSKDIINKTIQIDGIETMEAGFFGIDEFPKNTTPLIKKMIERYFHLFR